MTRTTGYWTGTLAAPLPAVLLTIAILALTVGLSETIAVFILVAYGIVLMPLAAAHGVVRLTGSTRWLSYAGAMFAVTFFATLAAWQTLSFSPDSAISIEWKDGVEQPVPLPLVGVFAAFLIALIEVACVTVFWWLAIRPADRAGTSA